MQVLYILVFMTALLATVVLGVSPEQSRVRTDKRVIAAHMAAWHFAAIRFCSTRSCDGAVDPASELPGALAAAPAFDVPRFSSFYDPASKLIVTSVNADVPSRTGVSFGMILSGLNEPLNGESSSIGVFDRASGDLVLASMRGATRTIRLSLPPAVAARIPDGSAAVYNYM